MTQHEAYVQTQVEALKRAYLAVREAAKLIRETAPNMRDYGDYRGFEAARERYTERIATLDTMARDLTRDAIQLQKGTA